jgi:hypothetical protein
MSLLRELFQPLPMRGRFFSRDTMQICAARDRMLAYKIAAE